jgi:hypothetical protein
MVEYKSSQFDKANTPMVYPPEVYSPEPEIRVEPEKEPNYYEVEATKSMYYTHSGSGEEPVSTEPRLAKEDQFGNGEEDPLAKKRRRRRRRRVRMIAGGTAGGLIVGPIIFFGPIGLIVGVAAGAVGARVISKRRERRKDERVARENVAADTATPTEMSQAVLS